MTRRKSSCCCKGKDCPDSSKKGCCCHGEYTRPHFPNDIRDAYCAKDQCRAKCDPSFFPDELPADYSNGIIWTANNDCKTGCLGSCCYKERTPVGEPPREPIYCADWVTHQECYKTGEEAWFQGFEAYWTLGASCASSDCGKAEVRGFCCRHSDGTSRNNNGITITKKGECSGTWEEFPHSGLGLADPSLMPNSPKYPVGFCGGAICYYETAFPNAGKFRFCVQIDRSMWYTQPSTDSTLEWFIKEGQDCLNTCSDCRCVAFLKENYSYVSRDSLCAGVGKSYQLDITYSASYGDPKKSQECGEGSTQKLEAYAAEIAATYNGSNDYYVQEYHVITKTTVTPIYLNHVVTKFQLPQSYMEISWDSPSCENRTVKTSVGIVQYKDFFCADSYHY